MTVLCRPLRRPEGEASSRAVDRARRFAQLQMFGVEAT